LSISAFSSFSWTMKFEALIDKIFSDDLFRTQSQALGRHGTAENAWGVYGKPPSITDMLESTTGQSGKLVDYYDSEYDRSVKRQKKISEELTGGKME